MPVMMPRSAPLHLARLAAGAAMLLAPVAARAQQPGPTMVAEGRVVRLRLRPGVDPARDGTRPAGRLARLDADSVVLALEAGRAAFPRAAVTRLEVYAGRRSRGREVLRGASFGLLGGAALGALAGAATHDPDDDCRADAWLCPDLGRGFDAAIGAVVLGGIGAVAGGTWGATRPLDRWRRVPMSELRVGLAPRGVVVSIRT